LLLLLSGCASYSLTFELADVINAPGDDLTREELDVDILLLTPKETEKYSEIVDGTMRSDVWFRLRDEDDPKIKAIPASQILALRRGGAEGRRDTLKGASLISKIDRSGGGKFTLPIKHPDAGAGGSAIVIYGRFRGMSGMAKRPPLVIQPLPGWGKEKDLLIKVGRTDMTCVNCGD
jgi:hypothetical protein